MSAHPTPASAPTSSVFISPAATATPLATVATADPLPAATTVAPPTPIAPTPATPTTTTKLDAGAPTDAGTAVVDAGQHVDAGAPANGTFKACSEKCQAVLVGCALPQISKDGGLPTIKDPVACQAAANACIAACTP